MKIIDLQLASLREYDNNPRKNDAAVEKVAASIREFGWKVPLVVAEIEDGLYEIVAGHTRFKAAKKLGFDTAPCLIADDLTEDQIKAFRLADNKVGEFAEWDFDKLETELAELEMDMELFGFAIRDDIVLDVADEDFLQDTEITKDKKKKTIVCPHCGEEFEA